MKIAFAGTPEFAKVQLEALLKTQHEIVVVYTQPDKPAGRGLAMHASPVKTLAQKKQIPIEQPHTLKTADAISTLSKYEPDVMIVAAYGLLLPEAILKIPHFGCINVHASLLPRWRGASPIQQAILANDQKTGITLMKMDKGLDTGGILAQVTCQIDSHDTSGSLHDKLMYLGANFLIDKLDSIVHAKASAQEEKLATLAHKINKAQGLIRWEDNATNIECHIRAFNPWPIAFTFKNNQLVRLWDAKAVPMEKKAPPGTIIAHTMEGIIVATGENALLITSAQLSGKKCLPFPEILHGHSSLFAVGETFGKNNVKQ